MSRRRAPWDDFIPKLDLSQPPESPLEGLTRVCREHKAKLKASEAAAQKRRRADQIVPDGRD